MRKLFLSVIFLSIFSAGFSQVEVGVKFSPNLTLNRIIKEDVALFDYSKNGAGIRFSGGLFADIFFADRYAVHAGIMFSTKRAGLEEDSAGFVKDATYGLQYVQFPVGVKLFTGEIGSSMKMYFLAGGTFDVKMADKLLKSVDKSEDFLNGADFGILFDATVMVGTGMEMEIGSSNALIAGISYNRGLFNIVKDKNLNDDLVFKVDYLSIDLGFKF